MTVPWDVVVVGGGTAGIVGAKTAASFGARVLLVERDRTGGDCLWTGCVPSKSLLASASLAARARDGGRLGIDVREVTADFPAVMEHVHAAIGTIEPVDSPGALEQAGVEVLHAELRFTGPNTADADGHEIRFAQAIICTGSSPLVPPFPGLDETDPLTTDSVWELRALPERLVVLGGGPIGCELGQAFARLGAEVTIVDAGERILSREDPEAAQLVAAALHHDGVRILTGAEAVAAEPGTLQLEDGRTVGFDRLLVSVGRRPGTDGLDLDRAGVEVDDRGHVRTDSMLRTTNPDIWAAGDVTGHALFTHFAGVSGSLAASNAVLGLRRRIDTTTLPRVTYTDPEVAAVGVGIESAASDPDLHVVVRRHSHVDRAVTDGDQDGFSKLVVDGKGHVLGGTVVSPRAGETLGELSLAVRAGLRTRDLAGTTHAYPTYNDGVWTAAIDDVQSMLRRPATARAITVLSSARRWWVRSSVRRKVVQARSR